MINKNNMNSSCQLVVVVGGFGITNLLLQFFLILFGKFRGSLKVQVCVWGFNSLSTTLTWVWIQIVREIPKSMTAIMRLSHRCHQLAESDPSLILSHLRISVRGARVSATLVPTLPQRWIDLYSKHQSEPISKPPSAGTPTCTRWHEKLERCESEGEGYDECDEATIANWPQKCQLRKTH